MLKTAKGFTLAEVLITLVVIGIIAAITVPLILSNYAEQEKASKVKKAYSTLANAMTRVKADGGDYIFDVEESQENTNNWFNSYIKPYFSTLKICYNEKGCWNSGDTYYLSGNIDIKNRKGIGLGDNIITIILNDGTYFNFNQCIASSVKSYYGVDINNSRGFVITFDINGDKKPNTVGKDIFAAVFTEDGIVPAYKDQTSAQIEADCSNSGTGYSCIQKYLVK